MKNFFLKISNNFSLSIYSKMSDIYCFSSVSGRLYKGSRSTSLLSHTVWYLLFQLSVLQASQRQEIYQPAITYSVISTVSAKCPAGFTKAGDLPACYHIQSDIGKNFTASDRHCRKLHRQSHLATVDTDEKRLHLATRLRILGEKMFNAFQVQPVPLTTNSVTTVSRLYVAS